MIRGFVNGIAINRIRGCRGDKKPLQPFFCVYRTLYRRFCFWAFFLWDTGQDVNCNLSAGNRQAETGKDRKIERNLV
ncbi:hypothetical protein DXA14_16540 [Hungatella hathewayi]|nr:hypothetical protein DXA14_16540 [Hungatella hathewayi]RHB68187.1 hypothetical protein DW876_17805 [Hungatella hathewayi]